MSKWPMVVFPLCFIANAALCLWLAWDGDNFPLIMLAVNVIILSLLGMVYGRGWKDALEGWGRSTKGWGAAQEWGIRQDIILTDVLNELREYDEEAVEIHTGRATNSSLEYLSAFEDSAYVAKGQKGR